MSMDKYGRHFRSDSSNGGNKMTNSETALVFISRDEDGRVIAKGRPDMGKRGTWLANYLMGDLQRSQRMTHEILSILNKIEAGEIDRSENDGNAFNLILQSNGAMLEHLIFDEDPPEEYTLSEIRAVLERWEAAIEQNGKESIE